MPSTYAHYRLGQQVRRELEGNETGNQRRADNVTGLLGGMEFCAYTFQ